MVDNMKESFKCQYYLPAIPMKFHNLKMLKTWKKKQVLKVTWIKDEIQAIVYVLYSSQYAQSVLP